MTSKQPTQLLNSRPLDVHRWSEFPEVRKAADNLYAELSFNNSNYKRMIRVILLDLYHSWRTDPTQYVAYSRDENAYRGGRRYNKLRIKYDLLTNTVDALQRAGYVEQWLGKYYRNEDGSVKGYHSRMRATKMLIRFIVSHKIKPKMISRCENEELIILREVPVKEKKGRRTVKIKHDIEDYEDTRYVAAIRKDLKAYNSLLARTYIDVDDENLTAEDAETLKNKEYDLDLSRKTVHRVFNNGKWSEGGRFYGAWWMDCPKALRKYIVIDGDQTVELDYSGIHIHLLYALEKINYAAEKDDPYALSDFPNRTLNKNMMLVALNAENDDECIKGVWNNMHKVSRTYGITNHQQLKGILEALKKKHLMISKYIASGYGVKLQNYDAKIAEMLIKYFTCRNIPILSVHDSFICSASDEFVLKDQMELLYVKIVNRFLKLNHNSFMEELSYDNLIDYNDIGKSSDIVISIDRKSINTVRLNNPDILINCSQGRRQLKWIQCGNATFLKKVSSKVVW